MEHKRTIMICDDEEDLVSVYASALRKQYNILTASSGKACVEKYMEQMLHGKKIDVMLLDYRLGDSKGDDIACKIRELDGTKVILITAYDLEREKVHELKRKSCIVDLITKPIGLNALIEKVRQVLD
jgi:two-component system KDP operon response regulator KdpE